MFDLLASVVCSRTYGELVNMGIWYYKSNKRSQSSDGILAATSNPHLPH